MCWRKYLPILGQKRSCQFYPELWRGNRFEVVDFQFFFLISNKQITEACVWQPILNIEANMQIYESTQHSFQFNLLTRF